jgi:MerR family transcriptional regulator, thiopeptide resistance regulator
MLADPDSTAADHLRRQHRLMREQIAHRQDLPAALEQEMEARRMGIALTPDEQFEILGAGWSGEEYAAEAAQRWGDTAAWRQSQARTAALTKQDWIAIKAETDSNQAAFAAAMHAGSPAGGERAAALAEQHRAVSAGSVTATTRRIAASARRSRPT